MTLATPPLQSFIIHCIELATVELTKKKTKSLNSSVAKLWGRGPKI